jgi:hypothetical protein
VGTTGAESVLKQFERFIVNPEKLSLFQKLNP